VLASLYYALRLAINDNLIQGYSIPELTAKKIVLIVLVDIGDRLLKEIR
jgi:hypothetical protein